MKTMKKDKTALLGLFPAFLALWALSAEAAVPLRTFGKDAYPTEDTVLVGTEPNVLFFLDTSTSMLMSTKGELPTWLGNDAVNRQKMQDSMPLMLDANKRAAMLKDATFGSGSRPLSFGSQTAAQRQANGGVPDPGVEQGSLYYRYGKDLD
ncbi:MAG: hypothetical protein LBL51_00985, partial [Synergistaceae bacterium]|nr:hypothetical protein [Synergistaceae bacterium]